MNKEIADKWIAALRSGEYKQTKGHLHVPEEFTMNNSPHHGAKTVYPAGFCCLGVLCEIAIKEGVEVEKSMDVERRSYAYGNTNSFLPPEVQEWAAMYTNDGELWRTDDDDDDDDPVHSLDTLNDDKGYDFNQIADHIAKYWEHL